MSRKSHRSDKTLKHRKSGFRKPKAADALNLDQTRLELAVESLGYDGRGIARVDGRACFIEGALPGELIKAEVVAANNKRVEAKLLKVLEPSELRVNPPCSIFQLCGGCDLQHLNHEGQLKSKQASVNQMLSRSLGCDDIPWGVPIVAKASENTATGFGYRRKIRLACYFDRSKQKLLVGFRAAKSKKIIELEECLVVHPELQAVLELVNCTLNDLHQNASYLKSLQLFAHIECIADQDARSVCFRLMKPIPEDVIQDMVKAFASAGVSLWFRVGEGPLTLISGHESEYQLEGGLKIAYTPEDFLQVNPSVNQSLVSEVITQLEITEDDHVLDLFSGLGNFSLPVARVAKSVTAVEAIAEMVDKSKLNAKQNRLSNVNSVKQDLFNEDALGWLDQGADKVILDPPRAGAELISQHIGRTGAKKIAYVSCNPLSLARDSKAILAQGYEITQAQLIDMFAQTSHIETLLMFERKA